MSHERVLLRPGDLAGPLGLSRSRIYQLIARGEIPATRCGRSIRIPREAWEQWLADQARRALEGVDPDAERHEPAGASTTAAELHAGPEGPAPKQGSAT
jgi:excisionase family DNA binding protein